MGLVFSISNFLLIKFIRQIIGVSFSYSNSALPTQSYYFLDFQVCYPPYFWFTFLTLMVEYGILVIFFISFAMVVPKEIYKFQENLETSRLILN